MTEKTIAPNAGIRRCAVCKIDLKGRFVYIDDEFENLLGYTKEELFGKQLSEFLDEGSINLVEQLLGKRNHYETFYESTDIVIINRDSEHISANVIVALNFIAGNPVNFQLIINSNKNSENGNIRTDNNNLHNIFLNEIIKIDCLDNLKGFARLLRKYSLANQVSIYVINENDLEPRAGSTNDDSAEFTFKSIPSPNDLHAYIAHEQSSYDFSKEVDVQKAIEIIGEAPNEYLQVVQINDTYSYLFRVIYSNKDNPAEAVESIERIKLGLAAFKRFSELSLKNVAAEDVAPDIKFTIGFLDSLSIPSFITNETGDLTGYNPSLIKVVEDEKVNGNFEEVISKLEGHNSKEIIDRIYGYMTKPLEEDNPEDLHLEVKLPSKETAELVIVKFSLDPGDLSSCFAFLPIKTNSEIVPNQGGAIIPFDQFLKHIKETLKAINGHSEKLGHEFYSKLGKDGNNCLENLLENTSSLETTINCLDDLYEACNQSGNKTKVDVGIVINKLIYKIKLDYPGVDVTYDCKDLPKLYTSSKLLNEILNNILSVFIKFNRSQKVNLIITSKIENDNCTIKIQSNISGLSEINVKSVYDFSFDEYHDNSNDAESYGNGIAISHCLVKELGGDIKFNSRKGKSITVDLILPVELISD